MGYISRTISDERLFYSMLNANSHRFELLDTLRDIQALVEYVGQTNCKVLLRRAEGRTLWSHCEIQDKERCSLRSVPQKKMRKETCCSTSISRDISFFFQWLSLQVCSYRIFNFSVSNTVTRRELAHTWTLSLLFSFCKWINTYNIQ